MQTLRELAVEGLQVKDSLRTTRTFTDDVILFAQMLRDFKPIHLAPGLAACFMTYSVPARRPLEKSVTLQFFHSRLIFFYNHAFLLCKDWELHIN